MRQRESYYAALERQRVGESTLRDRFNQRDRDRDGDGEIEALESLYTEVGMKAFTAFNSCLEWLTHLGGTRGANSSDLERSIKEAVASSIEHLHEEIGSVQDRMARMESSIAALEAGMRRIDKFTMEAFRNLQEIEERFDGAPQGDPRSDAPPLRGRLAKEEAASLALAAAAKMRAAGRRLTLASVAREAGLKYGQIVYAFGNKEGFFKALSESGADSSDVRPRQQGYEQTASA